MRILRLATAFSILTIFLAACNSEQQLQQPPQATTVDPYTDDATLAEEDYWAKDNFDLARIGPLLERADNPEQFEEYLNDDDGINNLDLNGDGYADYISVDEFEDRDSNSRGLSLFTRFGPDLIQEVARIFLYRDNLDYPGARILVRGDEHLYGDNYYYETNWLDRSLGLASYMFSDRDEYYRSPYYYDYYPSDYVAYEVVDTPIYVSRIQQLYPEPVLVYTTAPTFVSKIKIKSPHDGKVFEKVHAKLAKPTKEQAEFIKTAPARRQVAKEDRGDRGRGRDDAPGKDDAGGRGRGRDDAPGRADKPADRGNPNPGPPAVKQDRPSKPDNPGKASGQGQGKGDGQGQGKGAGQGQGKGGGQGQGKGGGQGKGKKP